MTPLTLSPYSEAAPSETTLLLLGSLDSVPLLDEAGWPLERAAGPLAATSHLARGTPTVLVVNPSCSWACTFISRLPPERRPAVLAVGGPHALLSELADEWVAPAASMDELRTRLQLATQRARLRRQVARRAFVDSLTGLPNRRAVVRALVRETGRSKRDGTGVALVLIDLDSFKAVNEELGHAAGDRLLRRVGSALRTVTRSDELTGRIGGDEFATIIRGHVDNARQAAARAQRALAQLGVGGTTAASERLPGERLRHLYRRTDRLLREEKARRHREGLALTRPTVDLSPFIDEEESYRALE